MSQLSPLHRMMIDYTRVRANDTEPYLINNQFKTPYQVLKLFLSHQRLTFRTMLRKRQIHRLRAVERLAVRIARNWRKRPMPAAGTEKMDMEEDEAEEDAQDTQLVRAHPEQQRSFYHCVVSTSHNSSTFLSSLLFSFTPSPNQPSISITEPRSQSILRCWNHIASSPQSLFPWSTFLGERTLPMHRLHLSFCGVHLDSEKLVSMDCCKFNNHPCRQTRL